jgi:6-phosphogluconolactonase (cycloisomerase 2 family)
LYAITKENEACGVAAFKKGENGQLTLNAATPHASFSLVIAYKNCSV